MYGHLRINQIFWNMSDTSVSILCLPYYKGECPLHDYVTVWWPLWNVRHYLVCMSHQEWTDCLGIPWHTVHISCLRSLEDSHMLLVHQCPRNMCGQTCKSSHTHTHTPRCGKVAMKYITLKLESITSVFLLFFLLLSRRGKWEKGTNK